MMERSDVAALGERSLAELIVAPPEEARLYIIRVTSGTTGAPIVIATGYDSAAPLRLAGDERVERMVACIGSMSARLANVLLARSGPHERVLQTLALDPQDLVGDLEGLLADYHPEGLHGFCSFVVSTLAYMSKEAAADIRVVKLTGELLSESTESLIRGCLPAARHNQIYIAAEAGGSLAERCAYLPRNCFHPTPEGSLEIHNPDADGIGDILVSKPLFRSMRIDRYLIGDVGKIRQGTCPCGKEATLELLGRKVSDYVKVAGAIIRREEFDRVASLVLRHMDDYRVEVSETLEKGVLKGKVVLKLYWGGRSVTLALCEEIAKEFSHAVFITPTQTLADLVEQGLFLPLKVEYSLEQFLEKHKKIKVFSLPQV